MQHGKGTNNFRNRHYPPLPIYGTFRHSPLTIIIILFLLTKHPTKIIVLWLNDERSALLTHFEKSPRYAQAIGNVIAVLLHEADHLILLKREKPTSKFYILLSFQSKNKAPLSEHLITLFHLRHTPYYIGTHPFRNKESLPLNETYIPFARDVYTYRSRPIYLSSERYIPLG